MWSDLGWYQFIHGSMLLLRVAGTRFRDPSNIGRQQLTTLAHTLLPGQSKERQCWQHYCMQHARVGVVSAMEIVSGAQTLLFPANTLVGQETWSPGESGPRGGRCDTAGGITNPAPSRLRCWTTTVR